MEKESTIKIARGKKTPVSENEYKGREREIDRRGEPLFEHRVNK